MNCVGAQNPQTNVQEPIRLIGNELSVTSALTGPIARAQGKADAAALATIERLLSGGK